VGICKKDRPRGPRSIQSVCHDCLAAASGSAPSQADLAGLPDVEDSTGVALFQSAALVGIRSIDHELVAEHPLKIRDQNVHFLEAAATQSLT
jgi:hypothetical protein